MFQVQLRVGIAVFSLSRKHYFLRSHAWPRELHGDDSDVIVITATGCDLSADSDVAPPKVQMES